MGFERNYQTKIPSNQIFQKRYYSSITKSQSFTLNPLFITGFTDAEGSFIIRVRKNPKYATGWFE